MSGWLFIIFPFYILWDFDSLLMVLFYPCHFDNNFFIVAGQMQNRREWFCLQSVFASILPYFLSSEEIYYIFIIMTSRLHISPLHWKQSSYFQTFCYIFICQVLEIISLRSLHWSSKPKFLFEACGVYSYKWKHIKIKVSFPFLQRQKWNEFPGLGFLKHISIIKMESIFWKLGKYFFFFINRI